jgi:hypothetical protein
MDATNIAENAGPAAAAATNPTLNLTPAASQAAPDLQVSQAASTPTASPELGASPKLVCELPLPVVEVPGASPAASQAANAKPLNMAAASVDANSSQQRQSTANVSASILGPALTRTGRDLLAQVEREAVITGRKQAGIDQTLADGRELLHQAGYPLDQPVDALFLHNLQRSAPQDGCEHGSKTASLDALGRAYVALTRTHFPVLLQSCTQAAKVTLAKLSAACGASIGKIRFWLADPYGGVTGMTPALALKIDNALAAQGKVVAAYAALAQDAAYEPAQSIMDQLLGRIPFGARLLAFRQQTHRPLKALLDQLQSEFGIKLVSGQLNGWEQGLYVPSEDMRGVISALDTLYQAHGELFAAWELEKPRQCQKPYALAFATWPSRLRAQVQSLVEYKTTNPQGLPEDPAADRWTSAATVAAFQDLCEQIFGFLVLEKGFAAEDLSLTLLCDWRLVRACFDWLRLRTRRVNFTTRQATPPRTPIGRIVWPRRLKSPCGSRRESSASNRFSSGPGRINGATMWPKRATKPGVFRKTTPLTVCPTFGGPGPCLNPTSAGLKSPPPCRRASNNCCPASCAARRPSSAAG